MSNLALIVNAAVYAGWLEASVTRRLETLAGNFSVSVSERWNGQRNPWPIRVEDECTVQLDEDVVLTGYVDVARRTLDATEHTVQIEGRDRAAVLVDCTPSIFQPMEFTNRGVLEFCQQLADPFGITVYLQDGISDAAISTTPTSAGPQKAAGKKASGIGTAGASTTATKVGSPKAKLVIEPGQTAFALMERACRQVGLLAVSDGVGNVILTRASSQRCATALVYGQNILSARLELDGSQRFAKYIVWGQAPVLADSGGEDDYNPALAASVTSTPDHGIDAGVLRTERQLVVAAEVEMTAAFANLRADWEAKVRAGRATQLEIEVQGWRQGDGSLWPINALVQVSHPPLGIEDEMLIVGATYSQSASAGTRTRLSVTRKDALLPEPTVAGGKALEAWWGVKGGLG